LSEQAFSFVILSSSVLFSAFLIVVDFVAYLGYPATCTIWTCTHQNGKMKKVLMKRIARRTSILQETLSIKVAFLGGEEMGNYHGRRELYSGFSGPQNSALNIQDIVSLCFFLLFFSRNIFRKIITETNRCAEQFMNYKARLFTFRSLVGQWTPATEY
jgi:hypothetical protein